jgi:hypothetical protein
VRFANDWKLLQHHFEKISRPTTMPDKKNTILTKKNSLNEVHKKEEVE